MAKTIKFNLLLDNKPIRTIEELQENFCIDDVLELYENGILQRWLKVRNFDIYLKKVSAIPKNRSAVMELIKIFDIEKSENEVKEAVYSLNFWEEKKLEIEKWNKKDSKIKQVIEEYHEGYDVLKANIIENKEDMPYMKSAAKEIVDRYLGIFKIDYKYFFHDYKENYSLIIYAILMNNNLRKLFLEDNDINEYLYNFYTLTHYSKIEKLIYSSFETYNKIGAEQNDIREEIKFNIEEKIRLHKFVGKTDGYWKDLEVAKTKVMVLSIPDGTFIRNADKPKEELSADQVNGGFLIMDGLVYKSNNSSTPIIYMEV